MRHIFSLLFVASQLATQLAWAATIDGDLYRNARLGLTLTAPPGWLISRQTGYPEILALMTSKSDRNAQLSVAIDSLDPGKTMDKLVAQNNQAMRALGIQVKSTGEVERMGRRVWRVVAVARDRKSPDIAIQQLYINAPAGAVILTLTCPSGALKRHQTALDSLFESVELSTPEPPTGR